MIKILINLFVLAVLIVLPMVTLAQMPDSPQGGKVDIGQWVTFMIGSLLNILWTVFSGIAILMVILAGYHFAAGKAEEGRKELVYAFIGAIAGVLAWSIPQLVKIFVS